MIKKKHITQINGHFIKVGVSSYSSISVLLHKSAFILLKRNDINNILKINLLYYYYFSAAITLQNIVLC